MGAARRCGASPPSFRHLDREPARRRPRLEIEWALRRWGSGPPLSATLESQPDRRAGTASNTDGTERCEAQVLGSPPSTIAPGRTYAGAAEEFAASALFFAGRSVRYPCGLISRVEPGATPGPATNFRVTPSLGTERACKACAFVPAWFDSRVTHHHCGRSWKVEHLSATQENRFRLPTSAPTSPVSKSGDCTRLKSAGGQFESGAGHHFGAGSGLQLILARSTSGVRLSVAPPSHSRRAISVRALRC